MREMQRCGAFIVLRLETRLAREKTDSCVRGLLFQRDALYIRAVRFLSFVRVRVQTCGCILRRCPSLRVVFFNFFLVQRLRDESGAHEQKRHPVLLFYSFRVCNLLMWLFFFFGRNCDARTNNMSEIDPLKPPAPPPPLFFMCTS